MSLLDPEWLAMAKKSRWLIGVSGGRDSIALLHACISAGLEDLVVCHVNHGLRGDESGGDETFVRDLAEANSLTFEVLRADVAELARAAKKSIELVARETRHSFFAKQSAEHQCTGVLLAHHADDQAETVMFNLVRGSAGLKGMQCIQQMHTLGICLHRPMLAASRSDIDAYISEHQLDYREDSSNAEDFATRNRIRNEVMPLLESIMGRKVAPAINRSLQVSQKMDALVEEMVDYESLLDPQGRLYLPSLEAMPEVLQCSVLQRYLQEQKISNISQDLIASAVQLLNKDQAAKVNLPKGKFLRRRQQRIYVEA